MAFKRAGANAIVSYYADRIDKILNKNYLSKVDKRSSVVWVR